MEKVFETLERNPINDIPKIHKMPLPRLLGQHPRYLQYKERSQMVQSLYDGNSLYEWNIDEISKHQIMNIFQEMNMAASNDKSKGNSDIVLAEYLAIDSLANWEIGGTITLNQLIDKLSLKEEQKNGGSMIVDTLIFTIIEHFIGDTAVFQDKASKVLQHLRCTKMGNFRYYKDSFISNIVMRPNN